ncbi:hypothetical protein BCV69DRAFT_166983 [Microstroma glucosiphilum]|uniref:Uncharacterized protein n=1 Tax=Pseudomicrostroma glucosiphilum TaxID=1684307 RepID=A0A316UE12_9BASI|nr:hypothetical protein BCV69DRAFT_166983 [Pseudomicrostroma glucosiphilum]PWN21325.1 hypothetical protein BCV69DRAFT_166983 [Pseudomicrostroma glucosiphilum]
MSEKNYLTPSLSPASSSNGSNPPPPYRFHQLPSTPGGSLPSSRPGSPPHGGSVPSPGQPGTFLLNLGKYGGYYVITIPVTFQRLLGVAIRRWKTLLFIFLFSTLAAFTMFGAMWTEWREMTYYRVDPYPIVPQRAVPTPYQSHKASQGKAENAATGAKKPLHSPPTIGSCPGPRDGLPIPHSPLQTFQTPESHPIPLVGDYKLVGMDPNQCLTYRSRYSMYSDEALGISYRTDVDEDVKRQHRAKAALYDDDPDNLKPVRSAPSVSAAANASNSTNAPHSAHLLNKARVTPAYNNTDSLLGPRKPASMPEGEWERYLRDRMWRANVRSEELGPESFPDWKALMENCFKQREKERGRAGGVEPFDPTTQPIADVIEQEQQDEDVPLKFKTTPQTKRTALVMRSYEGYVWREDDILNMRALIAELSLNNPNTPYDIRILVEVHGKHLAVFTSEWDRLNVLRSSVPREFWGMVELWTEDEMCALYPGLPGKFLNNMIAQSSYRSCLMALQKFYLDHTEYDFVWNWEMDVRYIGNYLDFFEGIEDWSRKEPLNVGMDKYDTWFVRNVTASEQNWADDPKLTKGRGEEADLITLGPIFDPRGSGWYWEYDVQNYPKGQNTHRRASIGTNMRMSRSLLDAMNVVNAEAKKSLHCEAWPTTLVLHSQLPTGHDHSFYPEAGFTHNLPLPFKGVYAPHPIYFRHHWDSDVLHARINRPDFYKKINEKVMRDSTFYYDGKHSKEIYMGWKERDDVCRSPMLLHPIKKIN